MRLSRKSKWLAAAAGVVALGAAATGAYAFWTTTGAGTGSGTASSNGTLVLHASFTSNQLYPGGSVPVSYTADNTNATDLQVGTIHAVVSTSDAGCHASDFSIADTVSNTVVGHGQSGVSVGGSTLNFANDLANSQDLCKGATITLTLSS